jgi:hypothetical protein
MKSIVDYWYRAKQAVIPIAGLALITASVVSLSSDEKSRRHTEQVSPTIELPSYDYGRKNRTFAETDPDVTFATGCLAAYFLFGSLFDRINRNRIV